MAKPAPAALAARGLITITDNLPPGAGLDLARDFVRIFRAEIEVQVLGLSPLGGVPCARKPLPGSSPSR